MQPIETTITEVVVFPNRARITRRGGIALAAGEHLLVLKNLPATLDHDSVRASGYGEGVRILGMAAKVEFAENAQGSIAERERELQALHDAETALKNADSVQAARLELLQLLNGHSGSNFARSLANGRIDLQKVSSLLNYVSAELQTALDRRQQIANELRDVQKRKTAAQERLDAVVSPQRKDRRREVHVAVEAQAAVDFTLEVTYLVGDASWTPLYDVRLEDEAVTVHYLASISQQTGEDWTEVALALSTARPSIGTKLPELKPWYLRDLLSTFKEAEAPRYRSVLDQSISDIKAPSSIARQAASPAQVMQSTIAQSGASVTYQVGVPVSVPSDDAVHKTRVAALNLAVDLDYVTAPKLAEVAYLRATVTNTSDYVLLPGSAAIFHGENFVGSTEIALIAANETFEVQLGVDDRVKVKRELLKRDVGSRLIGQVRRTQVSYRISLHNLLNRGAAITVFDQIPVSQHERIVTKLDNATPRPDEQTDLNVLKWQLEIPAGEKHEITFGFTVDQPRDMMVTGLEL